MKTVVRFSKLLILVVAALLAGCESSPASPTPRGGGAPAGPGHVDQAAPAPAAGIDDIASFRLDPYPEAELDPLARKRVPAAHFQNATVAEVARHLAAAAETPYIFYGEGVADRRVTLDLAGGASVRAATSQLCRAVGCYYAYYVNAADNTIASGVKLTERPFKAYGKSELGKQRIIHPY